MLYDPEISPKKLAQICQSWSRQEIREGIQFFSQLANTDSFYLYHVKELISEIQVRDQTAIGD